MQVPLLDLVPQYKALKGEFMKVMEEVCDSQRFILGGKVEKLEEEIRKCKKKREELSVYLFDSSKLLAKLRETVAFAIAEENNKKRILEEKEALIAVLETTSVCPLYAGMKCSTDKTEIIEKLKKEIGLAKGENFTLGDDSKHIYGNQLKNILLRQQ